jgi:hypothetical protein
MGVEMIHPIIEQVTELDNALEGNIVDEVHEVDIIAWYVEHSVSNNVLYVVLENLNGIEIAVTEEITRGL